MKRVYRNVVAFFFVYPRERGSRNVFVPLICLFPFVRISEPLDQPVADYALALGRQYARTAKTTHTTIGEQQRCISSLRVKIFLFFLRLTETMCCILSTRLASINPLPPVRSPRRLNRVRTQGDEVWRAVWMLDMGSSPYPRPAGRTGVPTEGAAAGHEKGGWGGQEDDGEELEEEGPVGLEPYPLRAAAILEDAYQVFRRGE